MADKTVEEKLDVIFDSISKRMDSEAEERKADRAKLDAVCTRMDAAEEERKADKARKDSEEMVAEKAKKDATEKEEKERCDATARADAAARANNPELAARLAAIESRIPVMLSEADRVLFVGSQVKAERVAQAFGDSEGAPRWMNGETLPDYQRRLLGKYKAHSVAWKDKDLARVDASVLDVAETQIYADAVVAASAPSSVTAGTLREQVTLDDTGRRIRRFHGDTEVTWAPFKQPIRSVTVVRTNFNHA